MTREQQLHQKRPVAITEGRHYRVDSDTGCWEWLGFRHRRGYAWMRGGAHRVMYEQRIGPVPEGHDVHHLCENTGCVNPDHLEALPRSVHRSAHKRAASRLTEADVLRIRERAATRADTFSILASEYGVSVSTINMIVRGDRWPDVGGPICRPVVGECAVCGASLAGLVRSARYCSLRCRQRANRRAARERKASRV